MNDFWHLRHIDWLNRLPDHVVDGLRAASAVRSFPKGALIFKPSPSPEHVFLLESGLVRIYRESEEAEQVTFGYVHPGEVFGECAVFDNRPRESFAAAHESSTVLRLSRAKFADAVRSSPSIMLVVAAQMEGRFKNVESRVEDLVFRDARSRLAHTILNLCEEFGYRDGDTLIVDLKLTHEEIGTLIGASRPTVSIALGEMEDQGILTRLDRRIGVNDADALRKIANLS